MPPGWAGAPNVEASCATPALVWVDGAVADAVDMFAAPGTVFEPLNPAFRPSPLSRSKALDTAAMTTSSFRSSAKSANRVWTRSVRCAISRFSTRSEGNPIK